MTEPMYKAIQRLEIESDPIERRAIAEEETRSARSRRRSRRGANRRRAARDGDPRPRFERVPANFARAVEQFRLAEYEANQNRILCATSGSRAARGRLTNDERWRALFR